MSIYDEVQAIAKDVLKEFNQGVIEYVKITAGTGPIDNPGASSETKYTLNAVSNGVGYQYVKSGLALASDRIITCAVDANFTPSVADFIDIDGERFKIVADVSSPASGTRAVWKFIVRKGG